MALRIKTPTAQENSLKKTLKIIYQHFCCEYTKVCFYKLFFQQNFHHVVFVTEVHLFYVNLVAPHTTPSFATFWQDPTFFQHAKSFKRNIIGPGTTYS